MSLAPRPPWRADLPTCKLYTRHELRLIAKKEASNAKDVGKKSKSSKEMETTWTVSPQDFVYVCRRLEEFLSSGRNVTVIVRRKKKWKEPSEEDVERVLGELRAIANKIPGAELESESGDLGNSMFFDFRAKGATSAGGNWPGPVPEKTFQISWHISEKQFQTQLKDIRQSLRKGKYLAVRIRRDIDEEVDPPIAPKDIISRIRLEAGNVRNAVEISPMFSRNQPTEEAACESLGLWELRFEADSENKQIPRRITIGSADSSKSLKLKLDWVKGYLSKGFPTRLVVHKQVEEVKELFSGQGVEIRELEKQHDLVVFEVEAPPAAKMAPISVKWEMEDGQERRPKRGGQQSSDAMQDLYRILKSNGNESVRGG
jgi:translation initiation factor IF-3